jgi:hypothetical protein
MSMTPSPIEQTAGSKTVSRLAVSSLPLLSLALPGHIAAPQQSLWLCVGLYCGLLAIEARYTLGIKILELGAAFVLCALALVDIRA